MEYLLAYFNKLTKVCTELMEMPDSLTNQKMVIISRENLEILYHSLFLKTTITILSSLIFTYIFTITTKMLINKKNNYTKNEELSYIQMQNLKNLIMKKNLSSSDSESDEWSSDSDMDTDKELENEVKVKEEEKPVLVNQPSYTRGNRLRNLNGNTKPAIIPIEVEEYSSSNYKVNYANKKSSSNSSSGSNSSNVIV